MDSAE